ncbi:hypothetical protein [Cryobacterium sp. Y11]|uniref:hypothetical protein n=1 Tax=Cryobacterium sp. Y11 TaxID=2045016 RepID=UPI000CE3F4CF|nr:hypothetical protein [Cryobacterium sp. Y11]
MTLASNLHTAGHPTRPEQTWGVFAAEMPGALLTATRFGDRWRLDGSKPWCPLADLQLYVRQYHAERDDAALGQMLVTRGNTPW